MKVLLTGFEPFDGEALNPALEAVKLVKAEVCGAEIVKLKLPTVFVKSAKLLEEAIEAENPDIVICVGQAGGRYQVTPERVAINIDDAGIPDNEGNQPVDRIIYEDGAPAYFSTLPIKAIVQEINAINLPAAISNSAGTYVCNHIMYALLHLLDKKYKDKLGGFIHVPYIPTQVINKRNMPSMSLEDIAKALEAAIKACVNSLRSFPNIETHSLLLRKIEHKDIDDLFQMRRDPRMHEFTDTLPEKNTEETRAYIDKMNKGVADNKWIIWAIEHKQHSKVIGTISIWNINKEQNKAELGYGIIPDYQGQGLMKEALSSAVEYGFGKMKLAILEAYTEESNKASIRLLEKCNFVQTDRVEEKGYYSDKVYNMAVYSLKAGVSED